MHKLDLFKPGKIFVSRSKLKKYQSKLPPIFKTKQGCYLFISRVPTVNSIHFHSTRVDRKRKIDLNVSLFSLLKKNTTISDFTNSEFICMKIWNVPQFI